MKINAKSMPNHENQNRNLLQLKENRHQIYAKTNPSDIIENPCQIHEIDDRSIGAIANPRHRCHIHAQIIEIDATSMPNH